MSAQSERRVNLLPADQFEYSALGRFLKWSLSTGRYLVVLTELVVIVAFLSRFWFDRTLTDLRESRIKKEGIVDSFQQVLTDFLRTQSQLLTIRTVLSQQYGVNDRLVHIQSLTPSGIEYDTLSISSESASLKGFAPSSTVMSAYLSGIQNDQLFDRVSLKSLQISPERSPGLDFELNVFSAPASKKGEVSS